MKRHNFSSGPAILPQEVVQQAAEAVKDFNGMGLSILEISHRSKAFTDVIEEAQVLIDRILGLNNDFHILFLTGGASSQFFQVPMNFLNENEIGAFTDTGTWAHKAIEEAKNFGKVNVLASSKEQIYNHIPKGFEIPTDAKYLHITSNNTIYGTQVKDWYNTSLPIFSDMSSDIFSKPIPVDKFGLIYAGAQKNLGPAGTTLVMIRKSMMEQQAKRTIPTMLNYQTHIQEGSLFNTPPVYPIYVCLLTLRWLEKQGGLEAMARYNEAKARLLYDEIDRNSMFKGTVAVEDRSLMNVCFVPLNKEHEAPFLELCTRQGMSDLKGHRSVGGFRASIYNAMPTETVQLLVDTMKAFEAEQNK